jgi:hypothetical protein
MFAKAHQSFWDIPFAVGYPICFHNFFSAHGSIRDFDGVNKVTSSNIIIF